MVETRRSAAAKRSAAVVEEEKGSLASPPLEPAEDAPAGLGAGDDVASSQPPKRAKVRIFFHSPFTWARRAFMSLVLIWLLVVGWVHGVGYREAVGGAGCRRCCGSTAQHGWAAGQDRRHGQAGGLLEVQGGSVQSGRYEPCPMCLRCSFGFGWGLRV
jgi:hypothetical protein